MLQNALRAVGNFEQVQSEMSLPLVMWLMPGEDTENCVERPTAVAEWFGDGLQVAVGERRDRAEQSLPRCVEHVPDEVEIRNIIVGDASATKTRHEIRELRRLTQQSLGREELFGDADMHELPGEMSSSGSWPPTECFVRVRQLGNHIDRRQCPLPIHFPTLRDDLDDAHPVPLLRTPFMGLPQIKAVYDATPQSDQRRRCRGFRSPAEDRRCKSCDGALELCRSFMSF